MANLNRYGRACFQFKSYKLGAVQSTPHPTLVILKAEQCNAKSISKILPELANRIGPRLDALNEPLKAKGCLYFSRGDKKSGELLVCVMDPKASLFDAFEITRKWVGALQMDSSETDLNVVSLLAGSVEIQWLKALTASITAATYTMPVYGKKAKELKVDQLKAIHWFSTSSDSKSLMREFEKSFLLSEGTNLVRDLGMTPANFLNPALYGEVISVLCKTHGVKLKFHSNQELKKMGAGSFTAVDQADPNSAGGIYEITYQPKSKQLWTKKPIALVGKGLCFDTGGYDVKVSGGMITMKGDMQGSAVALATLLTAARMEAPVALKAFLAVTENHISPLGFKADDVVVALNGVSIEVVNTDAEGRMVLADALCLASKADPVCIIDFATLTGSAVRAIGKGMAATFCNDEGQLSRIIRAGEESGERAWMFPMPASYQKALDSKVADTKQCISGGPDHILAALFLKLFVGEGIRWVHVDLSPSECEGGLGPVSTTFTGFGVRFAYELLEQMYG